MKALLSIPIVAALTCGMLPAGAAEPLKQQLVGTWRVISFVNVNERTGKTTEVFSSDPKGYFMFDAADHFSINLVRPGRQKYARRDFPMPGETRAALEGIVVMFGDYKVNESEQSISLNIIGGSFRNPLDAGGTIGVGVATGNLDRVLKILDRDPVIDLIVLEIGTGFRAQRWPTHEDELTSLLDKIAAFGQASAKPFVVILHPAHVETAVARAKQLARERGLVVFESFERAAAAIRVSHDYWAGQSAPEN